MDKTILLSINPKYCELIASGKKTVEIRKTMPKLKTPFKCYIYCTKKYDYSGDGYFQGKYCGKVIGEFVCGSIDKYESEFCEETDCYEDIRLIWDNEDLPDEDCRNFKIITSNEKENPNDCYLCKDSCLTFTEIKKYVGIGFTNTFYGWHISNFKMYDKPKKLSEFYKICGTQNCDGCQFWLNNGEYAACEARSGRQLYHPPQSWVYVEEHNL